jgi:molybdopterin-guanine dinucleotide biosynthesis protein A
MGSLPAPGDGRLTPAHYAWYVYFDAIILAGGRSSRLGGSPKAELTYDGETLLRRSITAARGARRLVVVGPEFRDLPPDVLSCREDPPFAGPAAAIAAGLERLGSPDGAPGSQPEAHPGVPAEQPGTDADAYVLVLACDMPRAADAVGALLEALQCGKGTGGKGRDGAGKDGAMAVSGDGRRQPLAAFYRTAALQRAVADAAARNALNHGSVFALLASLDVQAVTVPAGSTDDVDTWDDAAILGVDASNHPG